jgi:hypothetical protein
MAAQRLEERMRSQREEFEAGAPPDALEIMHRVTRELEESGLAERAIGLGDRAPDFALPNQAGDTVSLSEIVSSGPIVLGFYRGRW